jgi:CheY-like chemotaxis protein
MVEDNDEVASLVNQMLHELGYSVFRAASASAALGALANRRSFDIVFSDIVMPGEMDGVGLAREIRVRRPDLPIVLTSGYSGTLKRTAESEGLTVLQKPYDLALLATTLACATDKA